MNWSGWSLINNISSVLGILTFGFTLYVALTARTYLRKKKKVNEQVKQTKYDSGIHGILVVQICSNRNEAHIRTQVENFVFNNELLRRYNISGEKIQEVYHEQIGFNYEKDISRCMDDTMAKYAKLLDNGVDRVHLFYRGPVGFAALLGGKLVNGPCVFLYQFDPSSGKEQYQNWGMLKKAEPSRSIRAV